MLLQRPKTSSSLTCRSRAVHHKTLLHPAPTAALLPVFTPHIQVKEAIGSTCAAQVQAVTAAFEHAWGDSALQPLLFKMFNTTPARLSKADFAWMLADSAAMGDQYG